MVEKGRIQRLGCLVSVADLRGRAGLGGLAPHLSRGRHFVLLGGVGSCECHLGVTYSDFVRMYMTLLRHYPPLIVLAHVHYSVCNSITYYCTCLRHCLLSRHTVLGLSSDVRACLMSHCATSQINASRQDMAKFTLYTPRPPPGEGKNYFMTIFGGVNTRDGTRYIIRYTVMQWKSDRCQQHPAYTLRYTTMTTTAE